MDIESINDEVVGGVAVDIIERARIKGNDLNINDEAFFVAGFLECIKWLKMTNHGFKLICEINEL